MSKMVNKIKKFKRGWIGKRTKLTITSPYGYRKDPNGRGTKFHQGNDIPLPEGTPIYAPCDGYVTEKFQENGAGLYLILSSTDGYHFYFMHLKSLVKFNENVKEGDLIAYSGGKMGDPNAGCSTGPHLHFECRKDINNRASSIDSKYWITDYWYCSKTKRVLVQELEDVPLINTKIPEGEEEKKRVIYLTDTEINADKTYDASSETNWDETEVEKVIYVNKELDEGYAAGIWQIMKLVIDNNVSKLRVRDASTSMQQGSLMNFFQKMCQQPLVEFFGDTYGDQYYFVARKPPFDRDGAFKTMCAQGLFRTPIEVEQDAEINDYNTIYDIEENDIITSNISFNNQNIYSWFQFVPIYELGLPSELQYMIPAVLFPEYAYIWGSRSLVVRSQYRNFLNTDIIDDTKEGKKSPQGDAEVRHSIHDLKYIIECNAYNPFVRQGTIQIIGNRKFKRGTFIRIKWNYLNCSEIFYVESVAQNYSISTGNVQRTTTLTLSRGMLDAYMFSKENKIGKTDENERDLSQQISYFNLIDFGDYETKKEKITMDDWRNIISSWKVNVDVFNFFLRKMQFISQATGMVAQVNKNVGNIL